MKIILAPDSFKGSLSSPDAANALARGIRRVCPDAEICSIPLADGGEGTVDALVAATQGRRLTVCVSGLLGEAVDARFGLLGPDETTAVVEMASAAGLPLVPLTRRDPRRATTFGVGELIAKAFETGCARLIVGLGGSATNDGGAGAMQALGVRFLDAAGQPLPPGLGGAALTQIACIDASDLHVPHNPVEIVIASDVSNPLTGPNGASAVFGPQKGADARMVAELDVALAHYATLLERDLGVSVAQTPGAGAAGGLGAALLAFLGARMQSGINLVLDAAQFEAQARDADWIWTGEGKIDAQTLGGKAIAGVLARSQALGIPVIAFGGSVDDRAAGGLIGRGLQAAVPIVSGPMTLEEAMSNGARLLEETAARVMRLLSGSPRTGG